MKTPPPMWKQVPKAGSHASSDVVTYATPTANISNSFRSGESFCDIVGT